MNIRTWTLRGPCFDKYEIKRLQGTDVQPVKPVTAFYRLLQLPAPWARGDDATVHATVTGEGIRYKPGRTYYVREALCKWDFTSVVAYEADTQPAVDEGSRMIPWTFRGVRRLKAKDMPSGFARYAVKIRDTAIVQLADVTDEMAESAGFRTEMTDSGGFGPDGNPIDVPIEARYLFVEWVKGRYGLAGWDEIKEFLLVEYTFDLTEFQPDLLPAP